MHFDFEKLDVYQLLRIVAMLTSLARSISEKNPLFDNGNGNGNGLGLGLERSALRLC